MRPTTHFLLLFVLLLLSCGTDNNDVTTNPSIEPENKLLDFTKITDVSLEELNTSFGFTFPGVASTVINRNDLVPVTAYKITYQTKHPFSENTFTTASGLVIVPESDNELPIISYQHGTISSNDQVPSAFVEFSQTRDYLTVLSGLQYIMIAPDYLGYGASSHLLHPYEHGPTLAESSFDMLQAAKEFLDQESITYNDKLFLAGYSEGGYASMALHEHIEKNSEVPVTASFVGGGAYNKTLFAKEIMQKNEALNFIPNYLWVLFTYNNIYNINEPFSFYINEPYASNINVLNFLESDEISTNPQELFTENFRDIIINEKNHPIIDALKDNDRFDWNPVGKVYIIHGDNDNFVFPSNATSAFEAMKSDEANEHITLTILEGKNHSESGNLFGLTVPQLINELR